MSRKRGGDRVDDAPRGPSKARCRPPATRHAPCGWATLRCAAPLIAASWRWRSRWRRSCSATSRVSLLNDIGIGALVALGLVLLTGVGGATSFGQAAFVGIAAYATAWLTTTQGASPWLGLLFALLLTGSAALAIGMLTLRLGGHFLPLSTIAWGLSIALLFGNIEALGRHSGMPNIPALQPRPVDAGRSARRSTT